jgi:hypothetical protein
MNGSLGIRRSKFMTGSGYFTQETGREGSLGWKTYFSFLPWDVHPKEDFFNLE